MRIFTLAAGIAGFLVLGAVAAVAVSPMGGATVVVDSDNANAANAADDTVSGFLAKCGVKDALCLGRIALSLDTASQAHATCLPADLPHDDAAKGVLAWLRSNAASSPDFTLYGTNVGMQTAFRGLWPCQ
jgi:hypothetical protein